MPRNLQAWVIILSEAMLYAITKQLVHPLRVVDIAGGRNEFIGLFGGLDAFLYRALTGDIMPRDCVAVLSNDESHMRKLWHAIFERVWADDDLHRELLTVTLGQILVREALNDGKLSTRARVLEAIGPVASEGLDPDTFTAQDVADTVPITTMVRVVRLLAIQQGWVDERTQSLRPSMRPMNQPPPLPITGSPPRLGELSDAFDELLAQTDDSVDENPPTPTAEPTDDGPELSLGDETQTDDKQNMEELVLDLSELEKALAENK